ncbi:hemerythrin domain-containing protein [Cyclobacterium jeungdonense]|uniref:Hemerythrin domain-containing protein n=1 Tax=Cyclobacterium jeungdonense TaxID=708087 RepID=A0ABT8C2U1_9BACT|nr:hemerythrin domain-containing protein [Cyclobacterium jeungdonense]MDN3687041.1 hemerythrin domain-containing protein [Cyclobacterium jeungdonense]
MHPFEDNHKKSVADLVSENHILAGVLHYFGISFFQHETHSLEEACQAHKVNPAQVIAALEDWASRKEPTKEELYLHPIELVVGYLKKKHRYFVRQALPFLSSMVDGIELATGHKNLMTDLRLMFPLFVDDFIHHIHEEEDTLFRRIDLLQDIDAAVLPLAEAIQVFTLPSIAIMASDHEAHDDEMEGIRKLTNDYQIPVSATVSLKVLFHELQQLEKELKIHAKIENELLFPKAIELEKEVKRKITLQIKSN